MNLKEFFTTLITKSTILVTTEELVNLFAEEDYTYNGLTRNCVVCGMDADEALTILKHKTNYFFGDVSGTSRYGEVRLETRVSATFFGACVLHGPQAFKSWKSSKRVQSFLIEVSPELIGLGGTILVQLTLVAGIGVDEEVDDGMPF